MSWRRFIAGLGGTATPTRSTFASGPNLGSSGSKLPQEKEKAPSGVEAFSDGK